MPLGRPGCVSCQTETDFQVMFNARLKVLIENAGGRVDGIFLCPHAPEAECDCRKPRPGLLLQAAKASTSIWPARS